LFQALLFYFFAAVLFGAALGVIFSRNPVHAVMFLVLSFFQSAVLWLLAEAEFLAIVLVLVYVGAVMVLFLFVVMMLDIDVERLRGGLTRYAPVGLLIAVLMVVELVQVIWIRGSTATGLGGFQPTPDGYSNTEALGAVLYTEHVYAFELAAVILLLAIVVGYYAHHAQANRTQVAKYFKAGLGKGQRSCSYRQNESGESTVIGLHHYLTVSAVLFALSVAGIFINRRNLILLLMCIELMLLAVNFNFIAFSRYLGDETGQVFVFFILTVAAAEAAIGLAILVVLFRNRRSINVEELDSMRG